MKIVQDNACLIDGCERHVHIYKHGLCRAHYERYRKFGDNANWYLQKRRDLKSYRLIKAEMEEEKGCHV